MKKEKIKYSEGEKIGTSLFIKEISPLNGRRAIFKCKCGNLYEAYISKMILGHIKGCGCGQIKHGHTVGKKNGGKQTSEYGTWLNMIKRCYSVDNKAYMNYGGRGILVCERWRDSFEYFLHDMGLKPSKSHSIERVDNNGNYEPCNCKWETRKNQARNQRSNTIIEYNGEKFCIAEWSEKLGITSSVFCRRISLGWSIEKIMLEGNNKCNSKKLIHTSKGIIFNTSREAYEYLGISKTSFYRGLSKQSIPIKYFYK